MLYTIPEHKTEYIVAEKKPKRDMSTLQIRFNEIVSEFKTSLERFKTENNLDEGNIIIKINPDLDDIGGMNDGDGNRIPDIGFLCETEFILAENH